MTIDDLKDCPKTLLALDRPMSAVKDLADYRKQQLEALTDTSAAMERDRARLVKALASIIDARDAVRTSVQHYHRNRAEVARDSKAAAKARALLKELGAIS